MLGETHEAYCEMCSWHRVGMSDPKSLRALELAGYAHMNENSGHLCGVVLIGERVA